jgi:tetratricopeptide (TPR) repeat protein/TolB-like protein
MAECTDNRFGALLAAFELGLLTDEERKGFEEHLFQCKHCREAIKAMLPATKLMRSDAHTRGEIHRLADLQPAGEQAADEPDLTTTVRKAWPRRIIPISAAAAAVLIFLLLKPFSIEFSPTKEAVAHGDRLAVMYFDNLADPADSSRLGEIICHLLITDLSESEYVNVVSSQRLYDILKLLGREGEKSINKDVASQVAGKARARWMLIGSVVQVEPELIITAQLADAVDGTVIESQRLTSATGDVFMLVDSLTVAIKKGLALPAVAFEEHDRPIAYATTSSLEAYRYYVEAREDFYKSNYIEAGLGFRKAIQLDPNFAMAYGMLASMMYWSGDLDAAKPLVAKAMANIGRLSQREAFWIHAIDAGLNGRYSETGDWLHKMIDLYPDEKLAYFWLSWVYRNYFGRPDSSLYYIRRALAIDPLYARSYEELASDYVILGEIDSALAAVEKYLELAPDEPLPYYRKAKLLSMIGDPGGAAEAYERSLRINPLFRPSLQNVAPLYVTLGRYIEAESCLVTLMSLPGKNARAKARLFRAMIPAHQGKLAEAVEVLNKAIAADEIDNEDYSLKVLAKAMLERTLRDWEHALASITEYSNLYRASYPNAVVYDRELVIQFLAESGAQDQAQAALDSLQFDVGDRGGLARALYHYAKAALLFAKSDNDSAAYYFLESRKDISTSNSYFSYLCGVMTARALLAVGRFRESADVFEVLLNSYGDGRYLCLTEAVRCHYWLGIAYQQLELTDKAKEEFEKFLDIWKQADPGIPEIEDARLRLARLRSIS